MANDFIGDGAKRWAERQLEDRKAELGPLYPRIVPFVVRAFEFLKSESPTEVQADLSKLLDDVGQERLPLDWVLTEAVVIHRAYRSAFANDRFFLTQ